MIVVAIDGPSGAGKSTAARMLSRRLDLPYLDTGAMYRAVGVAVRRRGLALPLADPGSVARISAESRIDLSVSAGETRVWLDGEDVSLEIRLPEISLYASAVSAVGDVRRQLVALQRQVARARGGVVEGRDIGTRVFPGTRYKFFLTASEEERARRRFRELAARGTPQSLEEVVEEMHRRDLADSTRPDSPLACDETYTLIDSERLSVEEVVERMFGRIEELRSQGA